MVTGMITGMAIGTTTGAIIAIRIATVIRLEGEVAVAVEAEEAMVDEVDEEAVVVHGDGELSGAFNIQYVSVAVDGLFVAVGPTRSRMAPFGLGMAMTSSVTVT